MCWDYSECGRCGDRTNCIANCTCANPDRCDCRDCKSFDKCEDCEKDLCEECAPHMFCTDCAKGPPKEATVVVYYRPGFDEYWSDPTRGMKFLN